MNTGSCTDFLSRCAAGSAEKTGWIDRSGSKGGEKLEIRNMINYNLFKGLAAHGCEDLLPQEFKGRLFVETRRGRGRSRDCLCLRAPAENARERKKHLRFPPPKRNFYLGEMYREFQATGDLDGVFQRTAETILDSERKRRFFFNVRPLQSLCQNFCEDFAYFLNLVLARQKKVVDNKS